MKRTFLSTVVAVVLGLFLAACSPAPVPAPTGLTVIADGGVVTLEWEGSGSRFRVYQQDVGRGYGFRRVEEVRDTNTAEIAVQLDGIYIFGVTTVRPDGSESSRTLSSEVEVVVPLPVDGAPGRDGIDGQDGAPGENGATGEQGPRGEDGADGETGPEGPQGETGPEGPQGETGPEGPQGPRGEDGQDGQDGQDGADGRDGVDGVDGQDGQDGRDGNDGATGPQGPKGDQGESGVVTNEYLTGEWKWAARRNSLAPRTASALPTGITTRAVASFLDTANYFGVVNFNEYLSTDRVGDIYARDLVSGVRFTDCQGDREYNHGCGVHPGAGRFALGEYTRDDGFTWTLGAAVLDKHNNMFLYIEEFPEVATDSDGKIWALRGTATEVATGNTFDVLVFRE